jgi:hypothetical protein
VLLFQKSGFCCLQIVQVSRCEVRPHGFNAVARNWGDGQVKDFKGRLQRCFRQGIYLKKILFEIDSFHFWERSFSD